MTSSAKRVPALLGYNHEDEIYQAPTVSTPSPPRTLAGGSTEEIVRALCAEIGAGIERLLARAGDSPVRGTLFSIAQRIGTLLTQIVYDEVGPYPLEHGLERALVKLGAGTVEEHLARSLLRIAQSAGTVISRGGQPIDEEALPVVRADVSEFVEWYVARRNTILRIEEEQEFVDEEGLFGLHVCHDRIQSGAAGMEIACSVRLNHRAGQQIWLKATAYRAGQALGVRREWFYWVDDTDSFSRGDRGEDGEESGTSFAALAPLNPLRNACVIDTAALFIPYQALDLGESSDSMGNQDVEIEVSLLDESGGSIASKSLAVEIGKRRMRSAVKTANGAKLAAHAVPSPQAHGMWSRDLVSGDALSNVRVSRGFRGGWRDTIECLTIALDMVLRGHAAQTITVECRFLTLAGDVVKRRTVSALAVEQNGSRSVVPSIASKDFVASLTLHPQQVVSPYYDVKLEIPLVALELPAGNHPLYVEVAALSSQTQVLAGLLEPLTIEVPHYLEELSRVVLSAAESDSATLAGMPLPDELTGDTARDVKVDLSNAVTAKDRFNGASVVRIRPRLLLESDGAQNWRVVASLESLRGRPLFASYAFAPGFAQRRLVQQSVCVRPERVSGATVVTPSFAFDAREIAASVGLEGPDSSDGALVARLRVFSHRDELVCEHATQFPWRASENALQAAASEPPLEIGAIVDVRAVGWAAKHSLQCRAWLNVEATGLEKPLRLTVEGLDRSGNPLPGEGQTVSCSAELLHGVRERTWHQTQVEFEVDVSSLIISQDREPSVARLAGTMAKLSLFCGDGRLLHVVYHEILPSGSSLIQEARKMLGVDRPEVLVKERPSTIFSFARWLGF